MRIIKAVEQNILNEEFSSIFGMTYDGGHGYEGFSYELKPLSFNLEQKTGEARENGDYKFHQGDDVKGKCLYDDKEHSGKIQFLYWDGSSSTAPKMVYILDMETNNIIPLLTSTVKSDKKGTKMQQVGNPGIAQPDQASKGFKTPNVLY